MPSIEVSYSKKIGLRNYSSHSFSVSIKTEVPSLAEVEKTSNQLYAFLQETVDRNLQEEGYVPEGTNDRLSPEPSRSNGNGSRNYRSNGNGSNSIWRCSDRQRDLIEKVIKDNRLDEREIENWSQEMFQKSLNQLNKLEMSGLIKEVLDKYGDYTYVIIILRCFGLIDGYERLNITRLVMTLGAKGRIEIPAAAGEGTSLSLTRCHLA